MDPQYLEEDEILIELDNFENALQAGILDQSSR